VVESFELCFDPGIRITYFQRGGSATSPTFSNKLTLIAS
jgi:hypothetical protein